MVPEPARRRANARRRERYRLNKLLELERAFWRDGLRHVAGVDEVGRGPLAGPVVAAAVVFPPGHAGIRFVRDSKRLTAATRERLARQIRAQALCFGVGAASVREIDRVNILQASRLAMRRALARLTCVPEHVIVDGPPVPELGDAQSAVIDGDAKVHCVACASILAKVARDRLMCRLARRYPLYGWDSNAGYATAEHRDAILRAGATPHHRSSFISLQYTLELEPPQAGA